MHLSRTKSAIGQAKREKLKRRLRFENLESRELLASDLALVKDINATTRDSLIANLTTVGNRAFFVLRETPSSNGRLWTTDGTAAGTKELKEFDNQFIGEFTNVGGTLFFNAADPVHGAELWKSDGTVAGTQLVRDIRAGASDSSPQNLTNVNGTLFFTASDLTLGVWKSDGTEAGTVPVKDDLFTIKISNVGSEAFFSAFAPDSGFELWKSDGTGAGTLLVKDINPGVGSSYPTNFVAANGKMYFTANDGIHGAELWVSDGTDGGTKLVADIRSGPGESGVTEVTNIGGTLYFSANDGINGIELWKSDGSESGTVLVQDLWQGFSGAYPNALTNANGTLLFNARSTEAGPQLFKVDSSTGAIVLVKEIVPGGTTVQGLTNVNGTVYFVAVRAAEGFELWKSDGTSDGTVLVKDIFPGDPSSYPMLGVSVAGSLLFTANDGTHGKELWTSKGTEATTQLVSDLSPKTLDSNPTNQIDINGTLYFLADDGIHGKELWKSQGSSSAILVKDITPGRFGAYADFLTNVNGVLYFVSNTATNGPSIWKSDGSESGTVPVFEQIFSFPRNLVSVNGSLYFTAFESNIERLWKLDSSGIATIVSDTVFAPSYLTNVNGVLFFRGADAIVGEELFRSDGTPAGTYSVSDIQPGPIFQGQGSSGIRSLTNVSGRLFFRAFDGDSEDLWTSDGSVGGTHIIDIPTPGGSQPFWLTNVGGVLYFSATDGNGFELWKSDGTNEGTVELSQSFSFGAQHITNVNGTAYFAASTPDGLNGTQLWKADGTPGGVTPVALINTAPFSFYPFVLSNVNGILFFAQGDGTKNTSLWRTNGTAAGTFQVGGDAREIGFITQSGNRVYVRARTDNVGSELFALDLENLAAPSDILLSNKSIPENTPKGTLVGVLTTVDSDLGDSAFYSLVPGAGDSGNDFFQIVGERLEIKKPLDFEATPTISIRVRSTDSGGLFKENVFSISVTNVNEAPAVNPATFTLPESAGNGVSVGVVTASDPDAGSVFTWSIVSGNVDGAFAINSSGRITVADRTKLDFEVRPSYDLVVQAMDNGSPVLSGQGSVRINLTNVAETKVQSLLINGQQPGPSNQRSMVRDVTIVFSSTVTISSGAFELVRTGPGQAGTVALDVVTKNVSGRTVAVLTFGGALTEGNRSLVDGNYRLTIRANRVVDQNGLPLDGNGDGTVGDNAVDSFFRLFGDTDGDRDVDATDAARFRSTFGKSPGQLGYLWFLDYDGLNGVASSDFSQFRRRFGTKLNP